MAACCLAAVRSELIDELLKRRPEYSYSQLSSASVVSLLDNCMALLFPHHCAKRATTRMAMLANVERVEADLYELLDAVMEEGDAGQVIEHFMEALPPVSTCLIKDAEFILSGDPAARSVDEIILAYPGFLAIAAHRLAHLLHRLHVPMVPRLMSELAHARTGIDIHPGARIRCPFFIDHGTGVVIGETCRIGERVKVYQGVTLGALAVSKGLANKRRHPTIQDDVVIYANSTVLGGDTVIGAGTVIGGNTWLTESVPPGSVVYHSVEVKVRSSVTGAWTRTKRTPPDELEPSRGPR